MTPERHARIEEIFQAFIDLPAGERPAYLDEACAGDPDLRAYVQELVGNSSTEPIGGQPAQPARLVVNQCPICKRCYDEPILACPADQERLQFAFPGSILIDAKYKVERFIGQGAMGAVYLVNHVRLDKRFALKLISTGEPIPDYRRRSFEAENRLLAQLKHPHIVDVTDAGIDPRGEGMPYLVMEYLEGQTVEQFLEDRHGALPFPEAIRLLRQVAEGVDAAHARNIVHGDLKPANLFLARETEGEVLNIVDFGLARLVSRSESQAAQKTSAGIRGTPAYMAHELFRGEDASPASDRFALGVIAYELLTGDLPFGGHNLGAIREKQRKPPMAPSVRNPSLPPELDAPILALLNPAPDQRPARSVAAVAAIEKAWLAAEQRQWRTRQTPRRAVYAAIGAAAAILIAGLAALSTAAEMLEDWTVDARFAILPPHPPDPHLLLVVLDEPTLKQDPSRGLLQRDTDYARMIDRAFQGGARAVAIDNLLPAQWSRSPEFSTAVMTHADHLTLAESSEPDGSVIGAECISPAVAVAIGSERISRILGFVNLDSDPDGAIRRPRIGYIDRNGREQPAFAARAVLAAFSRRIPLANRRAWIDYSVRPGDIPKLSWNDVAARSHDSPALFRDRLVIIGGEWKDSGDEHPVPPVVSPDLVSGTVIQALIANTILTGFPVRDFSLLRSMLAAAAACYATFLLALRFPHRAALAFLAAAVSVCGYALFAFAIFRTSRIMVALAGPELAFLLSILAAWLLQSRLEPYPQSIDYSSTTSAAAATAALSDRK